MRPLVSRLSQVARYIVRDQSHKILYQNRTPGASSSSFHGVLRLPAERAPFAPIHFASSQIRALHTTLQTSTPRDRKTDPISRGKHDQAPVATGKVHEERKATDKSGQSLKDSEPSDREVFDAVYQMCLSLSRLYPALQRDHDKVAKDVRKLHYILWIVGILSIIGEISKWYLGDDSDPKGSNPTSDEKHQKAERS